MGKDPSGKAVRRHVRGKTPEEVTEKVEALEGERKQTGGQASIGKPTVGEWIDEWLAIIQATRRPNTWLSYTSLMKCHAAPLRSTKLGSLRTSQIDRVLASAARHVSPTAAANFHRTLRAALNLAVKRRMIPDNPARYAAVPRVPPTEAQPLTVSEAQQVLEVSRSDRQSARWTVALALDLRQGEALGTSTSTTQP